MDLNALQTFRVVACDLNGQMRGKVVPGSYADKLATGAVRMPLSVLNVDLWGLTSKTARWYLTLVTLTECCFRQIVRRCQCRG